MKWNCSQILLIFFKCIIKNFLYIDFIVYKNLRKFFKIIFTCSQYKLENNIDFLIEGNLNSLTYIDSKLNVFFFSRHLFYFKIILYPKGINQ